MLKFRYPNVSHGEGLILWQRLKRQAQTGCRSTSKVLHYSRSSCADVPGLAHRDLSGAGATKTSYSAAIVLFIVKRRGAATMSEIGRELGLANSTVTGLIDTLEGRNLVQRYSDENDRRVAWVRLTHAGEEEIAYVRARRVEALRQWLPDVSEAELATCLAVFEKMLKAVALDPDNLPEQKGS